MHAHCPSFTYRDARDFFVLNDFGFLLYVTHLAAQVAQKAVLFLCFDE